MSPPLSGSDLSAYNSMRDNHAWQGTVGEWLKSEAEVAIRSAIENANENA